MLIGKSHRGGNIMRLQNKLSLTIGIILALIFAGVEYNSYEDAKQYAIRDLKEQAEKFRSLLMAFRYYQQQIILKYNVEMDEIHLNFLPAFAVGKISQEYPNWDNSGFSFENVSDQPRNPEHKADSIELEAMNYFRQNPKEEVLFRPFNNTKKNGQPYYLYARPMWTEKYCLKCHGNREDAPKLIREKYDNAWDYQVGDLRGLLSIKLPATTITDRAWEIFKEGVLIHFIGFIGIFSAITIVIKRNVTNPIKQLVNGLQAVAAGDYTQYLSGFKGEFKQISYGFNEMSTKVNRQQEYLQAMNNRLEERVDQRTEELNQKNHVLITLNKEKDDLLHLVVHDLKNPLNGILGLANVMLESPNELSQKELVEYIGDIKESGERMLALIKNLLNIDALESGKIPTYLEQVDVLTILQKDLFNYKERAKNKQLTLHLISNEPSYVGYVDKNLIYQVFDNLISNAIKYSPPDKNIYLRITKQETKIRLEIQDEGQGLSSEDQEKLFNKFQCLSSKPTGGEHSSGVGLFIVNKLMELQHGRIWCESKLGYGSTFIVEFPTP